MSYRYPKLNVEQRELLLNNDIQPEEYVVQADNETYVVLMNLKTRDEVTVRRNREKLYRSKIYGK